MTTSRLRERGAFLFRRHNLGFMALIVLGLLLQVVPYWQPMTSERWFRGPAMDDAYYYLAIARNLDNGAGLTYNGWETNGFQPLHLLVCWAVGHATGWHLTLTPALVVLLGLTVFALSGPILLRTIIERHAGITEHAWWFAPLAWFSNPSVLRIIANGMETAMISALWLALTLALLEWRAKPSSVKRGLALGLVLGIGFLVRNDFVVAGGAVAAITLHEAAKARLSQDFRAVIGSTAVAGALTLAIATPWIVFNQLNFGSIVPQSGAAEGLGSLVDRGRLLQIEYLAMGLARNVIPLPLPISQFDPAVGALIGGPLGIAAVVGGFVVARRQGKHAVLLPVAASATVLTLVYALFFGAPHWSHRWLIPWFAFSAMALCIALNALRGHRVALALSSLVLVSSITARVATDRRRLDRKEGILTSSYTIMGYIKQLDARLRVGALQSGLPHWVDQRVENLDGKVNPAALSAIKSRQFGPWLATSGVDVIVDTWLMSYETHPAVAAAYDVHKVDELVVLSRRELRWDEARQIPVP